jgi:hypothetical protein
MPVTTATGDATQLKDVIAVIKSDALKVGGAT